MSCFLRSIRVGLVVQRNVSIQGVLSTQFPSVGAHENTDDGSPRAVEGRVSVRCAGG